MNITNQTFTLRFHNYASGSHFSQDIQQFAELIGMNCTFSSTQISDVRAWLYPPGGDANKASIGFRGGNDQPIGIVGYSINGNYRCDSPNFLTSSTANKIWYRKTDDYIIISTKDVNAQYSLGYPFFGFIKGKNSVTGEELWSCFTTGYRANGLNTYFCIWDHTQDFGSDTYLNYNVNCPLGYNNVSNRNLVSQMLALAPVCNKNSYFYNTKGVYVPICRPDNMKTGTSIYYFTLNNKNFCGITGSASNDVGEGPICFDITEQSSS